MKTPAIRALPPPAVLTEYGLMGSPVPLPGGQGTTWRVGEAVIKPLDMEPSLVQWHGALLSRFDGRYDFRVSVPLQTTAGLWTTNGWMAWRYQPGAHVPRWPLAGRGGVRRERVSGSVSAWRSPATR